VKKAKPKSVGRPKKADNELRKKRWIRLSDDDMDLIVDLFGGSLQEFVDHSLQRLHKLEIQRKEIF
jgi:hypothetical protein